MQQYQSITEFIATLDGEKQAQVEKLRELILYAGPRLDELIKWNAPSYVLDGQDRITLNLMNKQGLVKLILHMGATRKEDKKASPVMADATGIIEWSSDIRGILTFRNLQDIESKQEAVSEIIRRWLSIKA